MVSRAVRRDFESKAEEEVESVLALDELQRDYVEYRSESYLR